MSLINQALRKAQRDRTPHRMAETGSNGPSANAPSGASGMKPGLLIGLIVAVALLLGLVSGLSIVLLKGNDAAPAARQASTTTQEPATPATAPTPPVESTAATPEKIEPIAPATASSNQAPPIESETTPPVVAELRKAREAAEAKAAAEAKLAEAEAKAADEAAARAAAEPSREIIEWLTQSKVTGVMLSETNSKIILNGNTYAVGEYVNYALGLKVMIVQEKRILFVDENGKKYMKRL